MPILLKGVRAARGAPRDVPPRRSGALGARPGPRRRADDQRAGGREQRHQADHHQDTGEQRPLEDVSGRAVLLGHAFDEEHHRREEHEHDLKLPQVREVVVRVLDVRVRVRQDALRDQGDEQADGDLRRRPGVDEDEQARERQAPEALEDDEVRGPSWTRTSIVPATA